MDIDCWRKSISNAMVNIYYRVFAFLQRRCFAKCIMTHNSIMEMQDNPSFPQGYAEFFWTPCNGVNILNSCFSAQQNQINKSNYICIAKIYKSSLSNIQSTLYFLLVLVAHI